MILHSLLYYSTFLLWFLIKSSYFVDIRFHCFILILFKHKRGKNLKLKLQNKIQNRNNTSLFKYDLIIQSYFDLFLAQKELKSNFKFEQTKI